MLVFITPLKSRESAQSWAQTQWLVERTIRSACAQSSEAFRMIVVCHERPEIGFTHPQLKFLQLNTPPPEANAERPGDDKRAKIRHGIECALEENPTHVMLLDADDCVSRRLAEFVAERPLDHGWYFGRGFIHYEDRHLLQRVPWRFQRHCGSSHILPTQFLQSKYLTRHASLRQIAASAGLYLSPLPFDGAIYCVGHGENYRPMGPFMWPGNAALRLARRALFGVEVTEEHRREFGLYHKNSNRPE
jgi:hypothetical protein